MPSIFQTGSGTAFKPFFFAPFAITFANPSEYYPPVAGNTASGLFSDTFRDTF